MARNSTRAAAAIPAFSILSALAAAGESPDLCARMQSLADSARDGTLHYTELRVGNDGRVTCENATAADASFCRWLVEFWKKNPYYNGLSRAALACMGLDPDPPDDPDPDVVVSNSMWTHGAWRWESEPLARGHVAFEFVLDIRAEANPRTWRFVARPL